jgi:predicted DNA-binding transcriptional regulator YafY
MDDPAVRRSVNIFYRNHRGEAAYRTILPLAMYFGECEWHPSAQWLLYAFDADKNAERTFAVKDILRWEPVKPTVTQPK